jgi:predicted 3-demethylubiquinone-9 3-methyltransferase (glyoxalase superfamily)
MNRITPFLWFDHQAEQAADFYMSVFPNSRKLTEIRTTTAGPGPVGSLLTISLELDGQQMTFLNGGPAYRLTEAFSFSVICETQAEIDHYWALLTEGGQESRCGWLKDKFGVSWQIVPRGIPELLKHPAAMRAMMGMAKFDMAALKAAAGE